MSSRGKRNRNMKQQQERIIIAYYRSHPVEFIEDHLHIKLNWYQRLMFRMAFACKKFNKFKEV